MSEQAQKVTEVVSKLLNDNEFADQVRQMGAAAVQGGAQSPEFQQYMDLFASTPGQLAGLGTTGQVGAECTCNSNTFITLTSLTTPICGTCCAITTTTTTSG